MTSQQQAEDEIPYGQFTGIHNGEAELVFVKTSLWRVERFARGYTTPVKDDFFSLDFGCNTFLGFLPSLELLIRSDAMPTCSSRACGVLPRCILKRTSWSGMDLVSNSDLL
jgi:hypothetical protein